ncbi:hypothetical protein L7F22_046062 [Adiantum nelumboides]|nr:hypothetical protein [Adiantum nelumboides]
MASPACHKLPSLPRLATDRPRTQHPLHSTLFPFPPPAAAHPDPLLPCANMPHSMLIFPSPCSTANVPFNVRNVFENVARDSLPGAPSNQGLGSSEASANSSFSSSSDFCMSSNSDNDEDDTGSSSASSLSSTNLATPTAEAGPLDSLASLCAALPIKRGLSRYFSGKSQSFSLLARVSSVGELAKPENPYVKRRKMAGLGADSMLKHHSYPPRCSSSAGISKRLSTCSRFKGYKSIPCPEGVSLEGLAKCFSVPEF